MPKKKNSMALFEVISKTRDKNPDSEVVVPGWVKPNQQDPQAQEPQDTAPQEPEPQKPEPQAPVTAPKTPEAPQASEVTQDPEASEVTSTPAPAIQTTSTRTPRRPIERPETPEPPIWSTDGGRLTLSLNYVSCMVASMGLLLLIVGAFVLGYMTASPGATDAQSKQTVVKRVAGKYYMIISKLADESNASRAEANRMAAFCNANGEPAEVKLLPRVVNNKVVKGQGNLIVWSATPFDSPSGEDVSAHALSIQGVLGVKYAEKYGSNNKFIQPQKNGRLAPIMFEYKPKKRR